MAEKVHMRHSHGDLPNSHVVVMPMPQEFIIATFIEDHQIAANCYEYWVVNRISRHLITNLD